jgi:alkanesulfonate monooxygenase SsuD/methylene tetrahydromethanopterin reductase-like flavin-dependent oxidoreductase (luciferase family)
MKFAFFTHLPWPEEREPEQIIAETTEQVQYAEELGFYSAWLAEHHFTRYSIGSSSLIIATHLAARTKKIRVGTAVLVSPLHNPLRLAEDTATLDLVSGGRLDVGFGRGTSGYEYRGYSVNPQESQGRFQESIKNYPGPLDHPRLYL